MSNQNHVSQSHVEARLKQYNSEQYKLTLEKNTAPKLTLPSTIHFRFFEYEKKLMREQLVRHNISRYDDAHFGELRAQFNAKRKEWKLPGVTRTSMRSWCTSERQTARDAPSDESFILPTTANVATLWRQACAQYVVDLRGAPQVDVTVALIAVLDSIANGSDAQMLQLIGAFVDIIVPMRAYAITLSDKVNEQQLYTLRLFQDNLLHKLDHDFERQFGTFVSTLGVSDVPAHSCYVLALQLLWNSFGLAIYYRRVDHVPAVRFDIGTSLGDTSGDLGRFVRFAHDEMTTLYCILGYVGSRVFNRYASSMSADGTDEYTIIASGIYGNAALLGQYVFAQKTVGMQSTGANAGTLCYPPADLFLRMLPIARAVFSPPIKSIEDGDRLIATLTSSEFLEICRPTLEQYGVAAFGERMAIDVFRSKYYAMMLRLCKTFAKVVARIHIDQVMSSLVRASSDVIAKTVFGKGGTKTMSIRSSLTAARALKKHSTTK